MNKTIKHTLVSLLTLLLGVYIGYLTFSPSLEQRKIRECIDIGGRYFEMRVIIIGEKFYYNCALDLPSNP